MTRTLLTNATLLDPEAAAPRRGSLLLEGDRIQAVLGEEEAVAGAAVADLDGKALAPGFIDLHVHGRVIFEEPASYHASIVAQGASWPRHGTTSYLVTTVAWARQEVADRITKLAQIIGEAGFSGAEPLGIHLEGPWISGAAAGAQPSGAIRDYDAGEGAEVLDRAGSALKMVTLAPELAGTRELLDELSSRGVVAALGHSLAGAEAIEPAIDQGLRHVTHLFNAMGPIHHREPGVAGFALSEDRLSCDLICDGAHVHPAMVRLASRAKGDRLMLISDRIEPPEPASSFGSGALSDDGTALRLPDGRLAGSSVTLDRAVRNAVAFESMTQLEAIRACTLGPARLLGIESERGTLRRGARADLVVLDDAGRVEQTWIAGRVFEREQ